MNDPALHPSLRRRILLGGALALLTACGTDPDGPSSTPPDGADPTTDTTTAGTGTTATDPTTASTTADGEDTTGLAETGDSDGSDTGEPEAASAIVLVHGSWMGAWSWDRVTPGLTRAGHELRVVELPAHGEDLSDPARATLDGYRDVVLATMDELDRPAVLVAHSMGGMVISAVAEARPDDVEALVYVAGYLPLSGQSLLDLAFMDPGSIVGEHLVDNGDGTTSIDNDAIGDVLCSDCSPRDVMLLQAQHRPEPAAPLATPIVLRPEAFGRVPRVYVHTSQDQAVSPILQDQMVAASPVAAEVTLNTAHSPMLTDPEGLVDAILSVLP